MAASASVVAVWNELTPYRLHVMRRVRDELPGVRVVNFFTHSVHQNSSPWAMEVAPDLNVEFDAANRFPHVDRFFHSRGLRLARTIEGVIRRENPVFVLMHGHNDVTRLALIRRLRRSGVPMVHASDANIFAERPGRGWMRPAKAAYWAFRSFVLRRMDGYMPMGTAGRAFYGLFGRSDAPCFTFPYEPDYGGLSDTPVAELEAFRNRHGLGRERRHLLCSSRLVPVKRVDVVIDAFCRVATARPDWDLLIAGDGPLRAELESRAQSRLPGRIKFLGFVQMEDLRFAYRAAECLVHASEREPWALVINEAVNAGLPVIATDVTGAAIELVRDRVNGRLVRPGCADSMTDAMLWLTGRTDLRAMGDASRRLLSEWRTQADPVAGFGAALEHFSAVRARRAASPSSSAS